MVVTLVWVVSMELTDQGDCWDDYSENNSIYIIVVPILSILMVTQSFPSEQVYEVYSVFCQINLLLLISIMKVVVTSLRTRSTLTRQQLQVPNFLSIMEYLL